MASRALIDTNIIIHREGNVVINDDIGLLFNWLDRLGYEKCIHPYSIDEIGKHKDPIVVNTIKAKIKNYNVLKTISPDNELIQSLRQSDRNHNDYIDTSIVNELLNQRVDLIITEDRGIHRKATTLGISEKTFKIDDFIDKCNFENPDLKDYKVLSVKKDYFGNINLNDHFFDSFKEDYKEFSTWFNRKADDICYISSTAENIKAFLYLKIENQDEIYTDIVPPFAPKKRLKIGTFKVTSTGYKLGERFLKVIFDNALQYNVNEIYVTIFDKREEQTRLINLLEEWGFIFWGNKNSKNGDERVYVRSMVPPMEEVYPRFAYPYISLKKNKWIVPIYPDYHTELFPDSILNNESPLDFTENEPHRNAIKKVYISRSINRNLSCGDIVLFYRTGGNYRGVITTIGVVESIITRINDENHFVELCRKRSVFNNNQLREFWNYKPYYRPFIVNFLYVVSLPTPKVNLNRLRELNIIQSAPRGFEPINSNQFNIILHEARANASYFVN
jgi:hypothetical protein